MMMGFNKRIFSREGIIKNLDNIMRYLDSDAAYLTDDFSVTIYRMFNDGKTEEEILEKIKELNKE
jgi:hypothetical protein